MKKNISLFLFLLSFNSIYACLNESRVLLDGKKIISSDETYMDLGYNNEYGSGDLAFLKDKWEKEGKIEDYSDYGVVLVYLGEYNKALEVFKEIEEKKPGLYSTAANMGTIYELLGDNELAYQWISKAIEIDPKSHAGSEWLHLKILEVKLKGKSYLNSQFLIGTDFGDDSIPVSKLSDQELSDLERSIFYQLNERMKFIKPKDEIIGLLLFELGNICSITNDATTGMRLYDKSMEYGIKGDLFKKRYDYVYKLHTKNKPKSKEANNETPENDTDFIVLYYIILGTIILGIIGFIFWKFKKK